MNETHVSPMRQVLIDAGITDSDPELAIAAGTDCTRQMNMIGGRPSDAARSAVRAYLRLGRDAYIEDVNRAGREMSGR